MDIEITKNRILIGDDISAQEGAHLISIAASAIDRLNKSELSRTELIKQNAALAAENERLENECVNAKNYIVKQAEFGNEICAENYKLKAVIKAAQEQEPVGLLSVRAGEKSDFAYYGYLPVGDYCCYRNPIPKYNPVLAQSPAVTVPDGIMRDALRYRWLRDSDNFPMDDVPDGSIWDELCEKDRADFDEFIDFMMKYDAAPPASSHDRCPSHEPAEQEGKYENVCLRCSGKFIGMKCDRVCGACSSHPVLQAYCA